MTKNAFLTMISTVAIAGCALTVHLKGSIDGNGSDSTEAKPLYSDSGLTAPNIFTKTSNFLGDLYINNMKPTFSCLTVDVTMSKSSVDACRFKVSSGNHLNNSLFAEELSLRISSEKMTKGNRVRLHNLEVNDFYLDLSALPLQFRGNSKSVESSWVLRLSRLDLNGGHLIANGREVAVVDAVTVKLHSNSKDIQGSVNALVYALLRFAIKQNPSNELEIAMRRSQNLRDLNDAAQSILNDDQSLKSGWAEVIAGYESFCFDFKGNEISCLGEDIVLTP